MDNLQKTTDEKAVSRPKDEIIREAKRMEESLLYTSKGHFAAAHFWSNFHLWIGIPIVCLSALAGAAAFAKYDANGMIAGLLSLVVVVLSGVATFLNPNEKSSAHLSAGNNYDSLMTKVRVFSSIDCWREDSDEVLAVALVRFVDQKDRLNLTCPQVPTPAYNKAKRGIKAGEGEYTIDKTSGP